MKSATSIWRTTTNKPRTHQSQDGPAASGRLHTREILDELGLTVSEAAKVLDMRRATLSDLINGNAALPAEMALRIERRSA